MRIGPRVKHRRVKDPRPLFGLEVGSGTEDGLVLTGFCCSGSAAAGVLVGAAIGVVVVGAVFGFVCVLGRASRSKVTSGVVMLFFVCGAGSDWVCFS